MKGYVDDMRVVYSTGKVNVKENFDIGVKGK